MLERDIRDLARIEGMHELPRLVGILAARTGGLQNFAEVGRIAGIGTTTLKRYIALLRALYLHVRIPGWHRNLEKRLICADIFAYPVVTLKSSEGGALGAAIQALATAAGEPVADLSSRLVRVDEEARVEPRGDFDYGRVLERQNHLRNALFM